MADQQIFEVHAQEDFVERLTAARTAQALSELVWNGLDAEATEVTIGVERGVLGLQAIRVRDNGHGIPPEDAQNLFGNLGGSWKRNASKSKTGKRVLHGEEGKGRFRGLALGRVAEWTTTALNAKGQRVRYDITIIKDSARKFRLSDPVEVDNDAQIGTEVKISELYKDWNLEAAGLLQELNETYALYLTNYPQVQIGLLGAKLDPTRIIELERTFELPPIPEGTDTPYAVKLAVVEWKTQTERMLYLCSEDGFPLHRVLPGIQAPAFEFSAYLSSKYVSQLSERGALELAELDTRLKDSIENAKIQLRNHFKARGAEKVKNLVEQWKSEQVYPYRDEPATPVQAVERKVFDIVAVNVANSLAEFQTQEQRSRKFQLRMLRQAIERGPEELQVIIGEVLDLGQKKQEDLAKLLKRTTLASIISASKLVADRLDFLTGLEAMLYDADLKTNLKERTELHRMLADGNTWVFGEEFALTVDDQSLTEVLKKHLKLANRKDIIVDEPVKRLDGSKGIIDLMLSRRVPSNRMEELEHLVVELKAPTVKVGGKETSQIKSYAFAVQADERFRNVPTRWTFWLVANDMDEYATKEVRISDKPFGLLWESDEPNVRSRIWVKTWAQIIQDCRTRLRIFKEALEYTADKEASLVYLRETYDRILKNAGTSQPPEGNTTNTKATDAGAAVEQAT